MHVSDVTDEPDRSCDPVEETTSELEDRVEESASPGETRGGAYKQRGWVKWEKASHPPHQGSGKIQ